MLKIFGKIMKFKNRLVRFNDEEPLSSLSLCVIIALDIFILSMIFGGLSDHTAQLTQPYEYVPYQCRNVFVNQRWSEANKMDGLQTLVLSDYNNYNYRYKSTFRDAKINIMHPLCAEFHKNVKAIVEDPKLKKLFVDRQRSVDQKNTFKRSFNKSKSVYDTALLEDIANKEGKEDRLNTLSASIKASSDKIEFYTNEIARIEQAINDDDRVEAIWEMINYQGEARRTQLIADMKNFEFWYKLRELAWQALFILPIFVIFLLWSVRSAKKDNNIQGLISSHLLVVSAIPILLKTLEVVSDLIPRHFFIKLFDYLKLIHLVAIWHYIVIFLSVGVSLFLVYIIQKKFFNKNILHQKRLLRGACFFCGKKLPKGSKVCPFCGTNQMTNCKKCNSSTFLSGVYCTNCGDKLIKE